MFSSLLFKKYTKASTTGTSDMTTSSTLIVLLFQMAFDDFSPSKMTKFVPLKIDGDRWTDKLTDGLMNG